MLCGTPRVPVVAQLTPLKRWPRVYMLFLMHAYMHTYKRDIHTHIQIVVLMIQQMVLLFIQIVYISMSLAKVGNALGFYLLVSFLVHACGLVWLSVFLIPDQTLKTCVSRCRQGTAMASEVRPTCSGIHSVNKAPLVRCSR